ncbi:MAG TPA: hypothetical protein VM285_09815 [Polyangia bacterium]|nr:hypothetical protein [Polyangia bacterium]
MIDRPLDPSLWDESIPVAEDFYHHVNARWLAGNPVPAEYPMWGAYLELDHRNKELTHHLLADAAAASTAGRGDAVSLLADAAAASTAGRGDAVSRLAGDFFASGMDEAAIAAAGLEPLRPYLDRIDAIGSVEPRQRPPLEHPGVRGGLRDRGRYADGRPAEDRAKVW